MNNNCNKSFNVIVTGNQLRSFDGRGVPVGGTPFPSGRTLVGSIQISGDRATLIVQDKRGRKEGFIYKLPAMSIAQQFQVH